MTNIRLFMWGYQHYFQISAQTAAESIFEKLDKNLKPNVFLIGVLQEEVEGSFPICFQPEECGLKLDIFDNIRELAQSFDKVDGEHRLFHSHPVAQQRHVQRLKLKSLQRAVEYTINSQTKLDDIVSFCSWPAKVEGYLVFTVIQFQKQMFNTYYSLLNHGEEYRFKLSVSLLDATLNEYLDNCSKALREPDPGSELNILGRDYEEIIRSAGKRLMYTPANAGNSREGLHGFFEACNAISSLRYEGQEGIGRMIVAESEHLSLKITLILQSPVPIKNYRAVRKLLELAEGELCLLSDSGFIFGLGTIDKSTYNPRKEDLFIVEFTKHFTWELIHDNNILMTVSYGFPALPKSQLDRRKFSDNLVRIFQGMNSEYVDILWRLTIEATKQKHGTMLVISANAKEESERLAGQSIPIATTIISPELIKMVSSIDGAILIDQFANCYSIGVILDGVATKKGDPSRGARYNTAIRYMEGSQAPCLIVVVSEDGMINLIPNLKPQIRLSEITKSISQLKDILEKETIDIKKFNEVMEWLGNHKFYLLQDHCNEINLLRKDIERNIGNVNIRILYYDLIPNPEMDASYFLN